VGCCANIRMRRCQLLRELVSSHAGQRLLQWLSHIDLVRTFSSPDVRNDQLVALTNLCARQADSHCQVNNLPLLHQVLFDWLDEVLGMSEARSTRRWPS
jgi:hypothetical protein